ncbi:MAG TPA: hypothetical protein VF155_10775 [Candidatus Dormibacteraeota bacterium]
MTQGSRNAKRDRWNPKRYRLYERVRDILDVRGRQRVTGQLAARRGRKLCCYSRMCMTDLEGVLGR